MRPECLSKIRCNKKWEKIKREFIHVSRFFNVYLSEDMNKLKLPGQNLGRVFNSRCGRDCLCQSITVKKIRPNLELKTWPKPLLGYLSLVFHSPLKAFIPNCHLNANHVDKSLMNAWICIQSTMNGKVVLISIWYLCQIIWQMKGLWNDLFVAMALVT